MTAIALALPLVRSKRDYLSTEQVAALLKANLGLNRTKVTVKERSSRQYLTITVRDASVDIAAVTAFAASLHTWTMDQTDYCEGQAIDVSITKEVNTAHAAPFVEEIRAALDKLTEGQLVELSNGKRLTQWDNEFYVTADGGARRGCRIYGPGVIAREQWAIEALALQMARV